MLKLAKGLILLAALLTAPKVQATDPARPFEGGAVAPASAQSDATLPAPDGATLFAQHCAVCHKPSDLVRRVQGAGDAETAKASLPRPSRSRRCGRRRGDHRLAPERQPAIAGDRSRQPRRMLRWS